jgi:hypothetical protein
MRAACGDAQAELRCLVIESRPMESLALRVPAPRLVGLLAVLAISSGAVFVRLAQAGSVPSLSIAALRLFFASCVLVPLVLVRERKALASMSARQWRLAILSGSCLALHFGLWIASLECTSVATSVAGLRVEFWKHEELCNGLQTANRINPRASQK